MLGRRFVTERGGGGGWTPIMEADSVAVALSHGSDILPAIPHRIVRIIDGVVVSEWDPERKVWDPDPIARAEGWQLTQRPIDDLRLHILARVPTIQVEHHVEAAELAKRAIAVAEAGGDEVETTMGERQTMLSEVYCGESPLSFVVARLRLLGHLPEEHPLVTSFAESLSGVTPMRNEGSAVLYETGFDTKMGLVAATILVADENGMRQINMSYQMSGPHRAREIAAVREALDRELDEHPGICLTRKDFGLLEDGVAVRGVYVTMSVSNRTVFIGEGGLGTPGFPGFSVLSSNGGRWNVQDANAAMVAGGIKDHLTARCIAINHCLSGRKGYSPR